MNVDYSWIPVLEFNNVTIYRLSNLIESAHEYIVRRVFYSKSYGYSYKYENYSNYEDAFAAI